MLSVKDINNRRFEQTKPGYSPEEVDSFLREIAADIAKYQKDKEEAEKKIEVLVESVRENKKDEDALKDALVGAQKQSRAIRSEAQITANKIIADANAKADEVLGSIKTQLSKEKQCLAKMQQEVSDFKSKLLAMYKSHLESITSIPDYSDDDEDDDSIQPEEVVEEKNVQRSVSDSSVSSSTPSLDSFSSEKNMDNIPRYEKRPYPFSDSVSRPETSFGDLKFGQNSK